MYAHDSFMHQKCSNYALTNLLFGLFGLCEQLTFLSLGLVPIPKLQHALLTFEVLQAKEHTPTLSFDIFTFGFIKEFGSASSKV
jgi:hypothetical protein